jgi:fused signal recognition particle receptor
MQSFKDKLAGFFGIHRKVSEEVFDELTDLLVEGDFGAAGAYRLTEKLKELCRRQNISDGEAVRKILADLLEEILLKIKPTVQLAEEFPASSVPAEGILTSGKLTIILLLGVNGTGKTTTAAKLADRFRTLEKRKPILAAADTFRAAAVDQLKIHGERLGIRVVAHQQGGDPAAVVYDALESAHAGGGDLIIADTAGRMHTKSSLVE